MLSILRLPAALLLAAFTLIANASDYWVVGSFERQANAMSERNRLRAEGLKAEVSDTSGSFRVVIAKDDTPSKATLAGMGLDAWSTSQVSLLDVDTMEKSVPSGVSYLRVLASFSDKSRANRLADQLLQGGIKQVSVVSAAAGGITYHRVVQGPFRDKDGPAPDLAGYGLGQTWWQPVNDRETDITATTETTPEAASRPATVDVPEPVAVPEPAPVRLSPPRPGESYVDYCLKRAGKLEREKFCGNNMFNRLGVAQVRGESSETDRVLTCIVTPGANCED